MPLIGSLYLATFALEWEICGISSIRCSTEASELDSLLTILLETVVCSRVGESLHLEHCLPYFEMAMETPQVRGSSRSRTRLTCWHCGHDGHIRRRCFRRMRQRKRQMRDTSMRTDAREISPLVTEYD